MSYTDPTQPGPSFFDFSTAQNIPFPPLEQEPNDQRNGSVSSTSTSRPVNKRPKTGCLTCRLRKKRCDERKPLCATCERLGIDCLGYDKDQPEWLRDTENKKRAKQDLKRRIKDNRAIRVREARDSERLEEPYPQRSLPIQQQPLTAQSEASIYDENISLPPQQIPEQGAGPVEWSTGIGVLEQNTQGSTDPLGGLGYNDNTGFEEVMNLIFGNNPPSFPFSETNIDSSTLPLSFQFPSPTTDPTLLSIFSPPNITVNHPNSALTTQNVQPDLKYLNHYLNIVLPLQYRFVIKSMGDVIAPLLFTNPEISKSASSLAALHRSASRTKILPTSRWDSVSEEYEDSETVLAQSMHKSTLDRLRFVTPEELTDEAVVLPVLFAMSYYLFLGGTSRDWPDILAISRRCLSAAFAASPEITGSAPSGSLANLPGISKVKPGKSPWQRYRPLICALVWMDIVGSVSQNKPSRLLPVYRGLLYQPPVSAGWGEKSRPRLQMDKVMGCDDTTFLAIAETVALSEWRDGAEEAGCLSLKELMHRAAAIEKILDERSWRENTLGTAHMSEVPSGQDEPAATPESGLIPVMSEIFFNAARCLLASVIHGPFPKVPEIAAAVQETAEALHRLDTQHPDQDVNRALIFPITVAGSLCDTPAQQAFFRARFATLGPDAEAFGNSKQALQLLEEVWKRRRLGQKRVQWRTVMYELGWESGILLI